MSRVSHYLVLALAAALLPQGPRALELAGDTANKEKAEAAAAKDAKTAFKKVLKMLGDLKEQVLKDGEDEAKTYDKFACFCKDTMSEKSTAIQEGQDESDRLSTDIEDLAIKRNGFDTTIQGLVGDISGIEKELEDARAQRSKDFRVYETNIADLTGALQALEAAIQELKASKTSMDFAQVRKIRRTVRNAALLAEALGLVSNSAAVSFFVQEPAETTDAYTFQSDEIITMLEKLETDFRAKRNTIDQDETSAAGLHKTLVQGKEDEIKRKEKELDTAKQEKANAAVKISDNSKDLSTVAAVLLDDQEYLQKLAGMCSDRAKTWDQRSTARQNELTALVQAIDIISSAANENSQSSTAGLTQQGLSFNLAKFMTEEEPATEAMEADTGRVEAAARPAGFLQRAAVRNHNRASVADPLTDGREEVVTLFRSKGQQLHSSMLAGLASQLVTYAENDKDPFAKVKTLIQELIDRMLKQANADANQKGWCDKSIADAKQKRDYAHEDIKKLNVDMAQKEALRDTLTVELSALAEEMTKLNTSRTEAVDLRSKEQAENNQTISEAQAAVTAVSEAIDILDKHYKTAAKGEVASFVQRGPADDAPDAGFSGGEAYTGAQGEAGGIIGMLEMIQSDFERTIRDTREAENDAQKEHLKLMTATGASLAEKTVASEEKTKRKDETVSKLADEEKELNAQTKILNTSVKELLTLHTACIDTGMSAEERIMRREDEIAALKQGLCILENFAKYGADAASAVECSG